MKKDETIKEQHKIIITVDGGLIQDIENIPPGIQVEIHDFDTEGADDSKITMINNEEAVVSIWTSNNVEVIAQNVPEDIELGFRDLPAPKKVLKDEGELSDIILSNIHLLTCSNCGRALKDVPSRHRVGVEEAGVLCIDPGRINYPREPDEPAQAYFECMDCR